MLKNLDFCHVEQSKGVLKGCLTENNANNSTLKKLNNHLTIFKGWRKNRPELASVENLFTIKYAHNKIEHIFARYNKSEVVGIEIFGWQGPWNIQIPG